MQCISALANFPGFAHVHATPQGAKKNVSPHPADF
jgi:hypothetical protein